MLNFIRAIPYILLISLAGGAYHWYKVEQLTSDIEVHLAKINTLETDVQTYKIANQTQHRTIVELEEKNIAQQARISTLTARNQELNIEKDSYLSIFRRHDLTNLARVKPGLIEPRINNGTKEIFRQLENDSKEQLKLEELNHEKDPYRNFVFNRP